MASSAQRTRQRIDMVWKSMVQRIAPVRTTIIGGAGSVPPARVERLLAEMRRLGGSAR